MPAARRLRNISLWVLPVCVDLLVFPLLFIRGECQRLHASLRLASVTLTISGQIKAGTGRLTITGDEATGDEDES